MGLLVDNISLTGSHKNAFRASALLQATAGKCWWVALRLAVVQDAKVTFDGRQNAFTILVKNSTACFVLLHHVSSVMRYPCRAEQRIAIAGAR